MVLLAYHYTPDLRNPGIGFILPVSVFLYKIPERAIPPVYEPDLSYSVCLNVPLIDPYPGYYISDTRLLLKCA